MNNGRPPDQLAPVRVECPASLDAQDLEGLTDVLLDCVAGGASVSFMSPLPRARALEFWREAAGAVGRGERRVLLARDHDGAVLGTITLILKQADNQPHRADVAKMLVLRGARHRGVAGALLREAERVAVAAGKTLLVLDTVTGTDADRLYTAQGWQRVGEIPDYALWPDGRPCPTTFFYKKLRGFRAYRAADKAACLALFDANCPAFFAPNERDDYASFLASAPPQYRVCVEGAQIIGAFGVLPAEAGEGRLNWILVDPRRQGTGLGSAMMSEVRQAVLAGGMHTVHIAASQHSAPFFTRFGATPERETRDGWGPGMNRIDMRLEFGL